MNFILFFGLVIVDSVWSQCRCLRGGLCRVYESPGVVGQKAYPCHCEIVSKGIFKPKFEFCGDLEKYCEKFKCGHTWNGMCLDGFGTFVCKCEHMYEGRLCDKYKNWSHSDMIHVWYPIQLQKLWKPFINGRRLFPYSQLIVKYDDGRIWSTTIGKTCVASNYNNLNNRCNNDRSADCILYRKQLFTHTRNYFECIIPLPFRQRHEVFIAGYPGPIGHYHDVGLIVKDEDVIHFNTNYRVFIDSSLERYCPYYIEISGCGETQATAESHMSGLPLVLSAAVDFKNLTDKCRVKTTTFEWFVGPLEYTSEAEAYSPMGEGTTISIILAEKGYLEGKLAIKVILELKDVVAYDNMKTTVFCFLEVYDDGITVSIIGANRYTCGVETEVNLTASITQKNPFLLPSFPWGEPRYSWTCPESLCRKADPHSKYLTFKARQPCGSRHLISLEVFGNPSSNKTGHAETLLHFDIPVTEPPTSPPTSTSPHTHPTSHTTHPTAPKITTQATPPTTRKPPTPSTHPTPHTLPTSSTPHTSPKPHPVAYEIVITCEPSCEQVNPNDLVTITVYETPPLGNTFQWDTNPVVIPKGDCDYEVPDHILMIKPHVLSPGTVYTFKVYTKNGSRPFTVRTISGPTGIRCDLSPKSGRALVDNFKISCNASSHSPPLLYWVYEGPERDLVTISMSRQMDKVVQISKSTLSVVVMDSRGLSDSLNISVDLDYSKMQTAEVMNDFSAQKQELWTLLSGKHYVGIAERIDRISKLADRKFPFAWKLSLVDVLAQIKYCSRLDCAIKTANALRRLTSFRAENWTVGVDDFVLMAGRTIHTVAKSLALIMSQIPQKSAYDMLPLITPIYHAACDVIDFKDPVLYYPYLDEDVRRIHFRKVQRGSEFARLAISEVGLFITRSLPHPADPFELNGRGSLGKMTIVSHFLKFINCVGSMNKSQSYFQLTQSANPLSRENQSNSVELSVTIIKYKNNFWWDAESNRFEKLIQVMVYERKDGNWTKAVTSKRQANILYVPDEPIPIGTMTTGLIQGASSGQLELEDTLVTAHHIAVPRGHGTLHFNFSANVVHRIRVYISILRPNYSDLKVAPILKSTHVMYNYYADGSETESHVFIGFHLQDGKLSYNFNVSLVQCFTRAQDMWMSESCKFGRFMNHTVVCTCDHMSLLSAQISAPDASRVATYDITFNMKPKQNWLIWGIIPAVLVILIALFGVAIALDRRDSSKRFANFLDDNYPRETHPYLVAVFTGGYCMSGTSANVALRISGPKYKSRVHILKSKGNEKTTGWAQDSWFIVFTKKCLGKIEQIELWHDNTGFCPDWYCCEIVIWDIGNNQCLEFPVQTWINYKNLYICRDTRFIFHRGDGLLPSTSLILSHFHAHLREEHRWASLFILHPRSLYTRLDRTVLISVLVLVSMATSMMIFFTRNSGPADDSKVDYSTSHLQDVIITIAVTTVIVLIPAKMFTMGKHQKLSYFIENYRKNKKAMRMSLTVTHLPVMTKKMYEKQQRGYSVCTMSGYIISAVLIIASFALIMWMSGYFGRNQGLSWFIVFILALIGDAFVVNIAKEVITAIVAAYSLRLSARDIVSIKLDPEERTAPYQNVDRLEHVEKTRVKRMYKPPFSWEVKKKAIQKAQNDSLNPLRVVIAILLLSVITILVLQMDVTLNYYKNRKLIEHLTRSKSKLSDLDSVRNRSRYFDYLRGTVLPMLHHITWYNGVPLPREKSEPENEFHAPMASNTYKGYCADYSTKLIGVPQLRQQRVSPDQPDIVAVPFSVVHQEAHGYLSRSNEDTKEYLPKWAKLEDGEVYYRTYRYWTEAETKVGDLMGPTRVLYNGGGYVEHLHWSLGKSLSSVIDLQFDEWLSNHTRVVFFTFNLYNMNTDKITSVTVITESLPSGVYRSWIIIDTASVSSQVSLRERMLMAVVMCLALVLMLLLSHMVAVIHRKGFVHYLTSFTGFVDVGLLLTGIILVVTFFNRYFQFVAAFEEIDSAARDTYTPLHSRFYHNTLTVVFFSAFCTAVATFSAITVHKVIGFEPIERVSLRTKSMLYISIIITIFFAFYVAINFYHFGAAEFPNIYTLFFKEANPYGVTGLPATYSQYLMFSIIIFLILNLLKVATLVHFYAGTADLLVIKQEAIKSKLKSVYILFGRNRPAESSPRNQAEFMSETLLSTDAHDAGSRSSRI